MKFSVVVHSSIPFALLQSGLIFSLSLVIFVNGSIIFKLDPIAEPPHDCQAIILIFDFFSIALTFTSCITEDALSLVHLELLF